MRLTGFGCLTPMDGYDLEERDETVPCSYSDVYCLDYVSSWHVAGHDDMRTMVSERDEAD